MKILLMGDGSNFHSCLAGALRRRGHEAVVASHGSRWMDTSRDIDLTRRRGRLGGLAFWLRLNAMRRRLSGFDVVSVVNPEFLDLKPGRNRIVFDWLLRQNRGVFLSAIGTDTPYVEACVAPDSPYRYSDFAVGADSSPHALSAEGRHEVEEWLRPALTEQCRHVYANIRGAVTALYEYSLSCERWLPADRLAYGGIPIDLGSVPLVGIPDRPAKVRLLLGMHRGRQLLKGTDRLLAAARRVVEETPDRCELDVVENVPYADYLERMSRAHVVLDQLYSYTPATNALLAMAMGLVAVSGGEEEFYRFIGEKTMRPVVNALPDDEALYHTLRRLVDNPADLRTRGLDGRRFVERHNDSDVVAARFLDFWTSKLPPAP